jgi:hypothetical protein
MFSSTIARSGSEYYALDERFWSTSTILEVCVEKGRSSYSTVTVCQVFDDQGGTFIAATGQVVGTSVDGNEISVDLDDVMQVKVTVAAKVGFEPVKLRVDALKTGDRFRPRGTIKRAVLANGEILRFKGMSPSLDTERRVVSWSCEEAAPVEIPFELLLCIEMEKSSGYGTPTRHSNNGLISTVELLSGEKIELTGLMPTLDLGREAISYGVRQELAAEIRLSDVRYILIESCRAQDMWSAIGQKSGASLSAQAKNEICGGINSGARIRLRLNPDFNLEALDNKGDEDVLTGTLGSCRDGVLVFQPQDPSADVVRVPMEYVQSLYLSHGKPNHTLQGAVVGLVVGLVAALATQPGQNEPDNLEDLLVPQTDAYENIARGVGITLAGGVVGAIIGSSIVGSEKWESVYGEKLDRDLRSSIPGEYQVAIGFSF